MYKVIVFDVDGTIIDTEKTTLMALKMVLEEDMTQEVDEESLFEVLGIPGEYAIKQFDLTDYSSSLAKWLRKMDELRGFNKIFNGISALLTSVEAKGLKLGIVTSRTLTECERDPLFVSFKNHFDCIITADDTEKHKPNGAPLLKLLEIMKIDASEALYIGDTVYDLLCAKDAGVDYIWAGWGSKEDLNNRSEPVATHPLNLSDFIGHQTNFNK